MSWYRWITVSLVAVGLIGAMGRQQQNEKADRLTMILSSGKVTGSRWTGDGFLLPSRESAGGAEQVTIPGMPWREIARAAYDAYWQSLEERVRSLTSYDQQPVEMQVAWESAVVTAVREADEFRKKHG
jgi:hypothetical protein